MLEKFQKLLSIASKHELSDVYNEINGYINEVENSKLYLVLLGEFSVGKSSLINALLKDKLLDVDTDPTTDKIYEIMKGQKLKITQKNDKIVIIEHPKFPYDNIILVDTPGITSGFYDHLEITKNYLNKKAVVILVLDISKGGITDNLRNFLYTISYFDYSVILNKADYIDESEINNVKENIEKVLKEIMERSPKLIEITSVSDGKIEGLLKILRYYSNNKLSILSDEINSKFTYFAERLRNNLESKKNQLNFLKEKKFLDIDEKISEIEYAKSELNQNIQYEKREMTKKIQDAYSELINNLKGYIYPRFEFYLSNPESFNYDVKQFLEDNYPELDKKIKNIVLSSVSQIGVSLRKSKISDEIDNMLYQINSILINSFQRHQSKGSSSNLPAGLGLVGGIAALLARANPVIAIGSIILGGLFSLFYNISKREEEERKQIEFYNRLEEQLEKIESELRREAEKLSEDYAMEIEKRYREQLKILENELKKIKNESKIEIVRIELEIQNIEKDINYVNSLLNAK